MSKTTDGHELRRREVSALASRILANGRIEDLTLRDLASKAGYSTHIVSHYFDNKEDLLIATLRDCVARQIARLKEAIGSGADVAGCLSAMLPLDEERMIDCRVWLLFWPYAISDERYKAVSDNFGVRWRHLMIGMLRLRGIINEKTPRAKRDELGRRLQLIYSGVSIHGTLNVWTAEQQLTLLREHVDFVLADFARDSGAPAPMASVSQEDGLSTREQQLAQENERLRHMLIEAMLTADQLRETLAGK